MAKVLFIGHQWPQADATAAGVRILELMTMFSDWGYDVHCCSAAQHLGERLCVNDLEVTCTSVEMNNSSFDGFVKSLQPNVVVFDRFMVEEQFSWRVRESCPDAIRVLDMEDLHCLRKARGEAIKQGSRFTLDLVKTDTARREVASVLRSDLSLVISPFEMDVLCEQLQVPLEQLHYIPFTPEPLKESQIANVPGFDQRADFVSIGNFLHAPNRDAVAVLKESIWPRIRRALPKAKLHVYGSHPSSADLSLSDPESGFLVHGKVDDANKVIAEARLMLAPLRFGAGQKGKLIQAMQNGTPSITTSVGCEGMCQGLDWGGLIEDDFDMFSEQAIRLYSDQAEWVKSQENGFQILATHFDRQKHEIALRNRIETLSQNLAETRKKNFTGSVFWHQSLRSTEYMSRWIEIKQKRS